VLGDKVSYNNRDDPPRKVEQVRNTLSGRIVRAFRRESTQRTALGLGNITIPFSNAGRASCDSMCSVRTGSKYSPVLLPDRPSQSSVLNQRHSLSGCNEFFVRHTT